MFCLPIINYTRLSPFTGQYPSTLIQSTSIDDILNQIYQVKDISASLAVVEAGGEDAWLVHSHHLGGHQAPAGVPVHLLRRHPGPNNAERFQVISIPPKTFLHLFAHKWAC